MFLWVSHAVGAPYLDCETVSRVGKYGVCSFTGRIFCVAGEVIYRNLNPGNILFMPVGHHKHVTMGGGHVVA